MRSMIVTFAIALSGCTTSVTGNGLPDGGNNNGSDGGNNFNFDFAGMQVCSPSDPPTCDGTSVKTCRFDGSGYDYQFCASGCNNGSCTCMQGDVMCQGQDVVTCGMDGMYHVTQTCANGTQCINGSCTDARCSDETMGTNPHALPTNAWPRYRHDNRNSGSTPTKVAAMPKLKWKVHVGGSNINSNGGLGSGPVVNQNNVLFQTGGDKEPMNAGLHSYDATGKQLWFFPAGTAFASSTPAVRTDGTSYFSIQVGGMLYAIDPMGKQQWQFPTGSQADSDPVVTKDGNVIYSSDDGSAYGLTANGMQLWKSDPNTGPGEVDGGIAESCDGKIYLGGRNGWFQLDPLTGKTIWSVPTTGSTNTILSSPYVTADGTMYGFDSGGMGYAIDAKGNVLWKKQIGPNGFQFFGGSATGKIGNTIFSILNDGSLHAVDAGNGNNLWTAPVGGAAREINSGPISDGNNTLYVNGNDGFVYAFDINGKQVWKLPTSGVAASMDVAGTPAIGNDGTLYVPGNDGNLYAFQ